MQENHEVGESISPSFSSYFSNRFAEIADRVVNEFREECGQPAVETSNDCQQVDDDDDDDSTFEFALVREVMDASADEIFLDGQVRPIFPIFNRDLLLVKHEDDDRHPEIELPSSSSGEGEGEGEVEHLQISLKSLFIQERESPTSCSSSEVHDESKYIRSGAYCIWRPKIVKSLPKSMRKKSNSTGTTSKSKPKSKSWRLRDLLPRSNSDNKDSFVFLTPKKKNEEKVVKNSKETRPAEINVNVAGKSKAKVSAHEAFYVQNKAMKEGDKRKSYLPYRPELVGFFANVNGLGRSFPHH